MTTRIEYVAEQKRKIRNKRVSRFVVIMSLIFLAITIGLGTVVYVRYHDTQKWSDSRLNGKMSSIPPEFAKNTYTVNMSTDVKKLTAVTDSLSDVENDGGLTSQTITKARQAYQQSVLILNAYNVKGGTSLTNQTSLKLDIDVYDIVKSAYEKPNAKKLASVIDRVQKRNLSHQSATDDKMLGVLNTIAKGYTSLNKFVDTYVPKLGIIRGDLVTVKTDMTQSLTDKMINDVDKNDLTKFPNIKKMYGLITSSKWQQIVNNNNDIKVHDKWLESVAIFKALSQSQYFDSSSVKTLADAQDLGIDLQGDLNRDGYTILDESSVTNLYVDNKVVKAGQYIRKDATVLATIDPIYQQIVTSLPDDQITNDDDANNDSDDQQTDQNTDESSQSS